MSIDRADEFRVPLRDPVAAIASTIELLNSSITDEAPVDLTVGYQAEASTVGELVSAVVDELRTIATSEGRSVVSIEFGGALATDTGFRAWGMIGLGPVGDSEFPAVTVSLGVDSATIDIVPENRDWQP